MIPLGVLASARVASTASGVSYLTTTDTSTGTTTRTFSGMSFGTAASNRNVIVVAHSRYRAPASATIGGVNATLHTLFSDTFAHVAVFSAVVPSGATGAVVVTHTGGNPEYAAVAAYSAYGTLAYSTHGTEGSAKTVTLTAPANCLTIAAYTQVGSPGDWAFSNASYNQTVTLSSIQWVGAYYQPATGSHTVTLTSSLTNYSNSALLAVDFTLT